MDPPFLRSRLVDYRDQYFVTHQLQRVAAQGHCSWFAERTAVAHIEGSTVQGAKDAVPLEFTAVEFFRGMAANIVHGEKALAGVTEQDFTSTQLNAQGFAQRNIIASRDRLIFFFTVHSIIHGAVQ
jgi:hypothetical protein